MDMSQDAKEKIEQIQLLEQNLQNFLLQRQTFQSQVNEVSSALAELENSPDAYKIIGNVMVRMEKSTLVQQLSEKKESAELRIKSIEKQEEKMRSKIEQLQGDVMKEMKQ